MGKKYGEFHVPNDGLVISMASMQTLIQDRIKGCYLKSSLLVEITFSVQIKANKESA